MVPRRADPVSARGPAEPANYVGRIEWDPIGGHEQGFRKSPEFRAFFAAVRPFFESTEEMRHYEATPVRSDVTWPFGPGGVGGARQRIPKPCAGFAIVARGIRGGCH